LAYSLGSRHGQETIVEREIQGLIVPGSALDIGRIWDEKEVSCDLPVENQTANEISIAYIDVSCNCTSVEPRAITVAPRQTAILRLKIDPTHRTPREVGLIERPFAVEVTPQIQKGIRPRGGGWVVHGIVRSRVTLDALSVQFGESIVYGQPAMPRKACATAHIPVERLEVTTGNQLVKVDVAREKQNPDQFTLSITPKPGLPQGRFASDITIDLITPHGDRLRGTVLPVQGDVQPEVRPLPAKVMLGLKRVGDQAKATVVLQGPSDADMAVEHIETNSPDTNVEAVDLPGSPSGRTFRITQRVTREGEQKSTVRFFLHQRTGEPLRIVTTDVHYCGEVPGTTKSAGMDLTRNVP
jgi:hypothetical protein